MSKRHLKLEIEYDQHGSDYEIRIIGFPSETDIEFVKTILGLVPADRVRWPIGPDGGSNLTFTGENSNMGT